MSTENVQMRPRARHVDAFRPPPVTTKFADNPLLAHLEMQAIKDGLEYTEIETKSGQKFRGYCVGGSEEINCGTLTRPDGEKLGFTYQGQFKDCQPHGYGKFEFHNGVTYEGTFKDGKKQGAGMYKNEGDEVPSPMRFENDKKVEQWPLEADKFKAGKVKLF